MNELLQEKMDELFTELDQTKEIQRLKELKRSILNDEKLKKLLEDYRNNSNLYNPKTIEMKRQIINAPIIQEYHLLEDELYFSILEINRKLETLFHKKRCDDENY